MNETRINNIIEAGGVDGWTDQDNALVRAF